MKIRWKLLDGLVLNKLNKNFYITKTFAFKSQQGEHATEIIRAQLEAL